MNFASNAEKKARAIAFYLPQFYPTPENDTWWGPGFTEWTNVARAKSLYKGHEQPVIPGELGFYDLRLQETRVAQAKLAATHGVEGFCYWHYWFGGRRMLERPFDETLATGIPNFPFCLGWANHSWKRTSWSDVPHKKSDSMLIRQTYPGIDDDRAHFDYLIKAFKDARYITIDEKPLFVIFQPAEMPDAKQRFDLWRKWAHEADLKGLYVVGINSLNFQDPRSLGLDAVTLIMLTTMHKKKTSTRRLAKLSWKIRKNLPSAGPRTIEYRSAIRHLVTNLDRFDCEAYPCVFPNWDSTPRKGRSGLVLANSTPALFEKHLNDAVNQLDGRPIEHKLLFIKSWNEWAEGNYLEPCARWGRGYLEALRRVIFDSN